MSGISNHYDTMTAIQSIIAGLNLPGSPSVLIQEVAQALKGVVSLPCISISPFGPERFIQSDSMVGLDAIGYGILVAIIAKPEVTSLELRLGWRQTLRRNLNNHSIPGLTEDYNLVVEPGNAVEPRAWFDSGLFVSGFVVRAEFQEPRS